MDWLRLHNTLNTVIIDEIHECALVLSLEKSLRDFVNKERQLFGNEKLLNLQLDPHITLLYCGFQDPTKLKRLADIATNFESKTIQFHINDVSIFFNRSGLLTNVHYSVLSTDLHALHKEVLNTYLEAGFQVQTPYIGDHYTPHISIFNRLIMPKTVSTLFKAPSSNNVYHAGGCHLVGEKQRR